MKHFDAIIIGAGLVGLTLAKGLSRIGYQVVLLDNQPPLEPNKVPPLFEQRAIVLSESSIEIFNRFGMQDCYAEAQDIKQVLVSEQGVFSKLRFDINQTPYERLARVKKAFELVISMRTSCLVEPTVTEMRPVKVKSYDSQSQRIEVQYRDDIITLHAKLIIAADGANSKWLEWLGIEKSEQTYDQTALISNLKISGTHRNLAIERFLPEGPLAFLPVATDEVAMVWCLSDAEAIQMKALDDTAFLSKVQLAFGYRFGKFLKSSPRHAHQLTASFADCHWKEGILIMGNAAHALHPVAGQGFNLSVRDIAELCNALTAHETLEEAVEAYLEHRAPIQASMSFISDMLPRIFLDRYRALRGLRSFGLLLCDRIKPLNRHLTMTFLGLRDHKNAIRNHIHAAD